MPRLSPPTPEEQRAYDLMVDETNHITPFTKEQLAELERLQNSVRQDPPVHDHETTKILVSEKADKIAEILQEAA
ncbi:hypothetical protein KBB89_02535 [Candidatus Gracilibacteria bacterium]|nr:hypothetical protein [Candidatus Gracilibacteria bacterium]